jgi:integrase
MSIPSATPYHVFASSVLALYRPPIRRPATAKKLHQVLGEFAQLCPTTADITPPAIAAWIGAHPGRSPLTAFSLLRAFRTAVRAGMAMGLLPTDPFGFRPPRRWWPDGTLLAPERPRHRSADEIRRVLARADAEAACGPWTARRLRAVVYAATYTGARRNEILGLQVADVDLMSGLIEIRPNARRPLKTAASRARLPVPASLGAALAEWLPWCPGPWLFPNSTRTGPWIGGASGYRPADRLAQLGERAGVKGLTFLALRHTFATLSEGWGIGELALQRILRHTSVRTQQHYRHADLDVLREAAAKVHF